MARRVAGVLLAGAVLAAPAGATEPAITPEADRVLWCASAFYWLAGSADDAGETAEAELYHGWAAQLGAGGGDMLGALGFDAGEAAAIIGAYDEQVLDEFGTGAPRYDVAACPELVGE